MLLVKRDNFLLFLVLFLLILPSIYIGRIGIPSSYFMIPFIIVFLFQKPGFSKNIIILSILWLLIVLEVLFTGIIQPLIKLNTFIISFDFIMYLSKAILFIFFYQLAYKSKNNYPELFYTYFMYVLGVSMLIGILQWVSNDFGAFLSKLYSINERQFELATRTDYMILRRIPGTSNFATAHSGVAAFTGILAIIYFVYVKKRYLLMIFIFIGAILNMIATAGRAGQIAFIVGLFFLFIYQISLKIKRSKIFGLSLLFLIIGLLIFIFFTSENRFVKRNKQRLLKGINEIFEGSGRVKKTKEGFSLMTSPLDYTIGISRVVQRKSDKIYVESEPFNIFLLYGVLGFVLQYSLICIIIYYLIKYLYNRRKRVELLPLAMASFLGLIVFLVYSFGYYLFRDIQAGMLPFVISATMMGLIDKNSNYKNNCYYTVID